MLIKIARDPQGAHDVQEEVSIRRLDSISGAENVVSTKRKSENQQDGNAVKQKKIFEEPSPPSAETSHYGDLVHVDNKTSSRQQRRKQTPATEPMSSEELKQAAWAHPPSRPFLLGDCVEKTTETGVIAKFVRASDFLLWLPHIPTTHPGSWVSPTDLPPPVFEQIQTSFYKEYQSDAVRKRYYKSMVQDPGTYLDRGLCVSQRAIGRVTRDSKYTQANGNVFRSCDICIAKRRLCARLVKVDGEVKLGILPLPSKSRVGIAWTDVAFWISLW